METESIPVSGSSFHSVEKSMAYRPLEGFQPLPDIKVEQPKKRGRPRKYPIKDEFEKKREKEEKKQRKAEAKQLKQGSHCDNPVKKQKKKQQIQLESQKCIDENKCIWEHPSFPELETLRLQLLKQDATICNDILAIGQKEPWSVFELESTHFGSVLSCMAKRRYCDLEPTMFNTLTQRGKQNDFSRYTNVMTNDSMYDLCTRCICTCPEKSLALFEVEQRMKHLSNEPVVSSSSSSCCSTEEVESLVDCLFHVYVRFDIKQSNQSLADELETTADLLDELIQRHEYENAAFEAECLSASTKAASVLRQIVPLLVGIQRNHPDETKDSIQTLVDTSETIYQARLQQLETMKEESEPDWTSILYAARCLLVFVILIVKWYMSIRVLTVHIPMTDKQIRALLLVQKKGKEKEATWTEEETKTQTYCKDQVFPKLQEKIKQKVVSKVSSSFFFRSVIQLLPQYENYTRHLDKPEDIIFVEKKHWQWVFGSLERNQPIASPYPAFVNHQHNSHRTPLFIRHASTPTNTSFLTNHVNHLYQSLPWELIL